MRAELPAVAVLPTLIGCAPITVSTRTASNADLSMRHTFAWEANRRWAGNLDHSIAGQDIHTVVNEALEVHGFRPADGQPPDLLVDYHVRLQHESEISGGRWQIEEYHYTEGTLIVALVDPESKRFLWRGAAQGRAARSRGSASGSRSRKCSRTFPRSRRGEQFATWLRGGPTPPAPDPGSSARAM